MLYFEDFQVGRVSEAGEPYSVTEDEIVEFGRRFDPQPFHLDAEAARSSIFGGLVCSSVHLFAITVALSQSAMPRVAAVSALGFDEVRLHAPARPGDALRVRLTTRELRASKSRPGCGIVKNRSEVLNQRDELVFSYLSAFLVHRRPGDGP